jgi:hypothetical protein
MDTMVMVEVDKFGSASGGANGGFENGLGLTGKSDDAAVMIGIAGALKYVRSGHGGNGRFEGGDASRVAPLGKIGHAFDEQT